MRCVMMGLKKVRHELVPPSSERLPMTYSVPAHLALAPILVSVRQLGTPYIRCSWTERSEDSDWWGIPAGTSRTGAASA
jgi:hypothetical protein